MRERNWSKNFRKSCKAINQSTPTKASATEDIKVRLTLRCPVKGRITGRLKIASVMSNKPKTLAA